MTSEPAFVYSILQEHGLAILRSQRVCNSLQTGMGESFNNPKTFASNDGIPLWEKIFNAIDSFGAPCIGDGQRLQLHPSHAPAFTRCACAKGALRDFLFLLDGKSSNEFPVVVRKNRDGITIPVDDRTYYVAANVLRGNDPQKRMAQQPWHCDHAEPGAFTGLSIFPFVVVFPQTFGVCYRCNVVLPTLRVMGEMFLEEPDVMFLRGDTVHGGSADYFEHRVHLYIERKELPRRPDNVTFLVDDTTIQSLLRGCFPIHIYTHRYTYILFYL